MSNRSRPLKSLITIKRIALVMIALTLLPLGNGQIADLLTGKSPAAAAPLAGPVTHVRDGDTIEVQGVPVRIRKPRLRRARHAGGRGGEGLGVRPARRSLVELQPFRSYEL